MPICACIDRLVPQFSGSWFLQNLRIPDDYTPGGAVSELRFALFGAGFWSSYQLAGWRELSGARCVAIYNRTLSKAEALAAAFGVPSVYADAEELLAKEQLDFVDIVTDPATHAE